MPMVNDRVDTSELTTLSGIMGMLGEENSFTLKILLTKGENLAPNKL